MTFPEGHCMVVHLMVMPQGLVYGGGIMPLWRCSTHTVLPYDSRMHTGDLYDNAAD